MPVKFAQSQDDLKGLFRPPTISKCKLRTALDIPYYTVIENAFNAQYTESKLICTVSDTTFGHELHS